MKSLRILMPTTRRINFKERLKLAQCFLTSIVAFGASNTSQVLAASAVELKRSVRTGFGLTDAES